MKKQKTITLTLISVMTAVTCILGPLSIAIPISPVPISFTNLAIYFSVIILGWRKGTVSYLVYLMLGFVGMPVFSSFSSGPAKLLGPTGGYLIGFIFMALIAGFFVDKFPNKIHMYVLGMVIGTIVTYVLGTAWLAYQANMTFKAALSAGVIPYIMGDIVKIGIAASLGTTIKKQVQRAGYL
ncbi:biotin transporter BioY [Natronincola ferrireducens]|uniref:Biotin transporter n=1 Tax=Natronincola ferrireducens TaxID=393762 RepID=A0A1G9GWL2_9FIRM|nr:biotin transporter BioY [Natronincola ferrireducens]SDL05058.1 biotin transport system substrate-specific component [Natronincola ferrireducens]